MKNAFAKELRPLESCQAPFSFYQLVEDLYPESNPHPMRRLCTLMRKMKVKSFIQEELILNEELLEEQNMATVRCQTSSWSHCYTPNLLSIVALFLKMG